MTRLDTRFINDFLKTFMNFPHKFKNEENDFVISELKVNKNKIQLRMSKTVKSALNLKQFMLRQDVLKLYRDIYRTISKVPDENNKKELRLWLREDFKSNKGLTDEIAIKMAIQVGLRSLKELQTSLELSGISTNTNKKSR